ncbi:nicotinate-nucleotide--dimethylbenzimidazole phosphoribosyltransferase, partial [Kitasatospora sp. LaBMicrA B282]|uniref:nicotinate-nucleotide--dimethylbenzimidazole phosphoribosyltransferase n=1 Tax=Kitasatospora sp. LaBMicrA B282 TaxID=3420949 RepID=UPI003D0F63A7
PVAVAAPAEAPAPAVVIPAQPASAEPQIAPVQQPAAPAVPAEAVPVDAAVAEAVVVEGAQPVVAAPVAEAVVVEPVAVVEPVVLEPVTEPAAEPQPVTEPAGVEAQALAAEANPTVVLLSAPDAAAPAETVAPETVAPETAAPEAPAAQPVAEAAPVAEAVAVAPVEPQPVVEAVPAEPAPAQPEIPAAAQPRRIAAFLADPAPLGLPITEAAVPAEPQPAAPPAEVVAEPVAAEAPAVEVTAAEAEAPAVAEQQPATEQPAPEAAAPTEADPAPGIAPTAETPAEAPEAAPAAEAPSAEVAEAPAPAEPAADAAPAPEAPQVDAAAEPDAAPAAEAPQAEAAAEAPAEPETPRQPAAPGYDDQARQAVHQVMRERRDIRNGFRPDPVPHEVLLRVLEAAHTAPSVGYSQPWDFVVIRSSETRRKMHALAERQREAYADSLPKGRAKQFKEIKIEAILDTPVNIVVTADRTRGGRHTLGRHTQPQMAPYSAALAVENLWLAARAEGLGVGWVSFFDEEEMVRELGLPEHLDVVAYLCVGYVDAFPDEPELQQQGWAKKRPLSWVVHEEQYGNRALPGEQPHSVLSEALRTIRPLDAKALGEAWDRQKRMTKPAGSLGMLEIISAQLSGLSRKCPPPIPEPACVAIFAADHGVHAQGVTPWPQEVTGQMVANFLAGGAVVNAFAAQVGAEVCVVDIGVKADLPEAIQQGRTTGLLPRKVKPGTDDMTQGPAMTREEALKALETGIETARDLVAAGNKILITGDMGIANTTASAALIAVFTGVDVAEVTGRGTGIDDETHARKVDVIRRALALHQPDPGDPIGALAAVGGLEHAAIAGFLLGAASLRTPVILDGVIAGAAALVAKAIAPEVLAACIAGHRSAEPGHKAALAKLGLRALIDLDLRLGEGTGALLALPLVQSAARAMHDVATFDSAGVSEKG